MSENCDRHYLAESPELAMHKTHCFGGTWPWIALARCQPFSHITRMRYAPEVTFASLRRRRSRLWIAAWLLPLLALRALIPAGFMPAAGGPTWVTMQVCTTAGLQDRRVQLDLAAPESADPSTHPTSDPSHAPCQFMLTAGGAPVPHVDEFAAFAAIVSQPHAQSTPPRITDRSVGSQSARGPPQLSV